MGLIQELQAKQGEQSDRQFARSLGVSPSVWHKIQTGERRPGGKFLRAVIRRYPNLQGIVLGEMTSRAESETIVEKAS